MKPAPHAEIKMLPVVEALKPMPSVRENPLGILQREQQERINLANGMSGGISRLADEHPNVIVKEKERIEDLKSELVQLGETTQLLLQAKEHFTNTSTPNESVPDVARCHEIAENIYWGNFNEAGEVDPQTEQVKKFVVLDSQSVADVYEISLAFGQTNLITQEIRYAMNHRSKLTPKDWVASQFQRGTNTEDAMLYYDTYQFVDELAARHLLTGMTFLCDFARNDSPDIQRHFTAIIGKALRAGSTTTAVDIIDSLPVNEILETQTKVLSKDPSYSTIVKALTNLHKFREKAKEDWSFDSLAGCTFLHNAVHHIQTSVLRHLLTPEDRHMSYELLLRFASEDQSFNLSSARKLSSYEGRRLSGKWKHFSPERQIEAKDFTLEEEGYLLGKELVAEIDHEIELVNEGKGNKVRAHTMLSDGVSSLEKYPLFKSMVEFQKQAGIGIIGSFGSEEFNFYLDLLREGVKLNTSDMKMILTGVIKDIPMNPLRITIVEGKHIYNQIDQEAQSIIWRKAAELTKSYNPQEQDRVVGFFLKHPEILERPDLSTEEKYDALKLMRVKRNDAFINQIRTTHKDSPVFWLLDFVRDYRGTLNTTINNPDTLHISTEERNLFYSLIEKYHLGNQIQEFAKENRQLISGNERLNEFLGRFIS